MSSLLLPCRPGRFCLRRSQSVSGGRGAFVGETTSFDWLGWLEMMRDAHLWAYVSPWDGIVSCRWIRYVVLLSGSHLKAICRSILYLQDRFPLSSAESFSPSTCPPSPVPAPRPLVWIKSRWWRTIIQMGLLRVFHLSNLSLSLSFHLYLCSIPSIEGRCLVSASWTCITR